MQGRGLQCSTAPSHPSSAPVAPASSMPLLPCPTALLGVSPLSHTPTQMYPSLLPPTPTWVTSSAPCPGIEYSHCPTDLGYNPAPTPVPHSPVWSPTPSSPEPRLGYNPTPKPCLGHPHTPQPCQGNPCPQPRSHVCTGCGCAPAPPECACSPLPLCQPLCVRLCVSVSLSVSLCVSESVSVGLWVSMCL